MQDLVERVAFKLANADLDGPNPEEYWRYLARAAIAAAEIEHLQSQVNPDVEKLAYSVANAKLGEGPAVRCEGPTEYEIAQARDWVRRVLAALKTVEQPK